MGNYGQKKGGNSFFATQKQFFTPSAEQTDNYVYKSYPKRVELIREPSANFRKSMEDNLHLRERGR